MNFLKKIFISDINFTEKEWENKKKYNTLLSLLSIIAIILSFFLIIRYIQGNTYLVLINSTGIIIVTLLSIFLRQNIDNYIIVSRLYILLSSILTTANLIQSDHHSRIVWLISIVVSAYYFRGKKEGLFWTGLIIITLTVNQFFNNNSTLQIVDYLAIVINFILISLALSWYEEFNEVAKLKLLQKIEEKEKVEEELKLLASTDPMTKLYNRRYFLEISEHILELSKRKKKNLTTLILDIDNFKNINDTYGHKIGDDVIITLSDTLKELTRKSDIVSRWGGEEFLILLPETSISGASEIAEKIRLEIEKIVIPIENNKEIKFTISIGISEVNPKNDKDISDLINRADEGLYEAKESGRNKVCIKQ